MITRYNYEEYFLLYTDNELPAAEKKAVEEFLRQNPDLQEELTMLRQSIIRPEDHIIFENKDLLLKKIEEGSLINFNNYEEYFLLYIDNEIDATTKKQVEEFLSFNPSLQDEFHLFGLTKLQPDNATVFEPKESLYKKKERKKPVLLGWVTSAAAVVILLVTGFYFFNKSGNPKTNSRIDISSNSQTQKRNTEHENKNQNKISNVTSAEPDSLNNSKDVNGDMASQKSKMEKHHPKSVVIPQVKSIEEQIKEPDDIAINAADKNRKNYEPKIVRVEKIQNAYNNKQPTASTQEVAPNKLIVVIDKPLDDIQIDQNPYASFASTQDDNDSERKTKLRGIFRKVSRVFNKTTNADEDSKHSVAIGSFQIALK